MGTHRGWIAGSEVVQCPTREQVPAPASVVRGSAGVFSKALRCTLAALRQ